MYRVLRRGGTAIIWYSFWKYSHLADAMRAARFKNMRLLFWEKSNPIPQRYTDGYHPDCREVAVCGVKVGKAAFHSSYDKGNYPFEIIKRRGKKYHPQKIPFELYCQLIEKHSNPQDLVVNCFLGADKIAEASFYTGRNFAGCDVQQNYVKATIRRLNKRIKQSV